MGVAPQGAPPMVVGEPAISSQGSPSAYSIDASPVRIERMLRAVFANELKIRQWEDFASSPGKRYAKRPGDDKPSWIKNAELVDADLAAARRWRDNHLSDLESVIDYALTTDAYEDVPCTDCPEPDSNCGPAMQLMDLVREDDMLITPPCRACRSQGTVRKLKTDPESAARYKRVSYFERILATTVNCAKIRYGTPGQNEAYVELEEQNRRLLWKFGNESQTSMEGDDAEQGARMGIIDAAMRFDPTRKEGATFGTVAYNWAWRNSRARKKTDKRAGVYAPSIDGMGSDEEGNSVLDLIASCNGAIASFDEATGADPALIIDMRNKIADLPETQRQVVLAIYGGDTVASAAKGLGMKRSQVRTLRDEAFATLRGSLSGYVEAISD